MEISKVSEEAISQLAQILAREFQLIDAVPIMRKLMGISLPEMLEAYAESLNIAEGLLGKGYSCSSPEYKEAEKLIQKCEHHVAQRVLKENGWADISVKMYYRKEK